MDRNSILNEDPLVKDILHENNICTVGVTNFYARINPAGMALMMDIDPNANFRPRFDHTVWGAALMHHANVTSHLICGLEGFCKLYRYTVHTEGSDTQRFLLAGGFPYEIDVREDSPLVGWFKVLQGGSDGR